MICLKPSSWLASQKVDKNVQLHGRSPYGERGLKSCGFQVIHAAKWSLSLRRAWIEIRALPRQNRHCQSLSLRRAWIEMYSTRRPTMRVMSLSLRRAWIEIQFDYTIIGVYRSLSLRRAWIEIYGRILTWA